MAVGSDGLIVINDRDETSFVRIDAIVLGASDHRWMVEMRPHRAKKEMRRFDLVRRILIGRS